MSRAMIVQTAKPYRFRVLRFLFMLVVVIYFDRLCIAVAGPTMQRDLGIAPSHWAG